MLNDEFKRSFFLVIILKVTLFVILNHKISTQIHIQLIINNIYLQVISLILVAFMKLISNFVARKKDRLN